MDEAEHDLTKMVLNSLLAQKLALVNCFSAICGKVGVSIHEVMDVVKNFPEIEEDDMKPNFGFWDPAMEKDVETLAKMSELTKTPILPVFWRRTLCFNEECIRKFIGDIVSTAFYLLNGKKIAILGFANVGKKDHVRRAPAAKICKGLLEERASINIYDPMTEDEDWIIEEIRKLNSVEEEENQVTIFQDPYEAVCGCSIVVICSDEEEIRNLNYSTIYKKMEKPTYLFDGFYFLPHQDLKEIGFIVKSVGKDSMNNDNFVE